MASVEGLIAPDGMSLGDRITAELSSSDWRSVRAAVAFVKLSGVRRLYSALEGFATKQGGAIFLSMGIDHGGSTVEAADALLQLTESHGGGLWIVHNPQGSPRPTYHPKLWLFSSTNSRRLLLVGSGNITQGGLFTNYEASVAIAGNSTDQAIADAESFLDLVSDASQPEVLRASTQLLQELHDAGLLPSEDQSRRTANTAHGFRKFGRRRAGGSPQFEGRSIPKSRPDQVAELPPPLVDVMPPRSLPPSAPPKRNRRPSAPGPQQPASTPGPFPSHRFFFITVRMASKTEVFLAKRPLDEDPAFFGAPFEGLTTPRSAGALPQPQPESAPIARITLHLPKPVTVDLHPLKMWTYTEGESANSDFRTNFTAPLQEQIPDDSVVRFERDPSDSGHLDFDIDIYPPDHRDYKRMLKKCDQKLPNSPRRYGWD